MILIKARPYYQAPQPRQHFLFINLAHLKTSGEIYCRSQLDYLAIDATQSIPWYTVQDHSYLNDRIYSTM